MIALYYLQQLNNTLYKESVKRKVLVHIKYKFNNILVTIFGYNKSL